MNALGVVKKIAELLAVISPPAGYVTDAGTRVFELVEDFSSIDGLPFVSVLFEGEEVSGGQYTSSPFVEMSGDFLLVGGIQQIAGDAATAPLHLIADIKRAAFSLAVQAALSDLGITLEHVSSNVLPREDGDAHAEVQVRARVGWNENVSP